MWSFVQMPATSERSPRRGGAALDLRVADCRALPFEDGSFDAVFEKGTLDAVFLSGGKDKDVGRDQLRLCVGEMARTVRRGGVVLSLSAPATEHIDEAFRECRGGGGGSGGSGDDGAGKSCWKQLLNGDAFITEEGFASINVEARSRRGTAACTRSAGGPCCACTSHREHMYRCIGIHV